MTIEIEIPDKRIADLLCSAWEGGSNYWARAEGQPYDLAGNLTLEEPIRVYDIEENLDAQEEGGKFHSLTLDKVRDGLKLMATKAPKQLGRFLAEDDDAITGDVLLQLSIFGEIVYG